MSYRVVFGGGGAVQYHHLPGEAQDAVIERAAELADEPWDRATCRPGGDPAVRETTFGDGRGVLEFYVDEDRNTIRLFNFLWLDLPP